MASEEDAEDASPLTPSTRAGLGLCLSGGGYRVAIFHLGALRRLNELSLLHQAGKSVRIVSDRMGRS